MNPEQQSGTVFDHTGAQPSFESPKKRSHTKLIIIVVAALIGLSLVWVLVMAFTKNSKEQDSNSKSGGSAESIFREMVDAVSEQKKMGLVANEQVYANKADFEARKTANEHYSIAEYDSLSKEYRALFIAKFGRTVTYYEPVKCLESRAYVSGQSSSTYATLEAARQAIAKPFTQVEDDPEAAVVENCAVNNSERRGRLTDGIVPIGMSKPQIDAWFKAVGAADFFTVTDEGEETYQGKKVRRISFVTNSLAGMNQFKGVAQEAGLAMDGADSFRLDTLTGGLRAGNVVGAYLIDEKTKLPVYSEFASLTLISQEASDAPGGILRHQYSYPDSLSLSQTSNIPVME